jgi:hypothetical protein
MFALSVLFFSVLFLTFTSSSNHAATLKNKPFETVARCAIILHTPVVRVYVAAGSDTTSMLRSCFDLIACTRSTFGNG